MGWELALLKDETLLAVRELAIGYIPEYADVSNFDLYVL